MKCLYSKEDLMNKASLTIMSLIIVNLYINTNASGWTDELTVKSAECQSNNNMILFTTIP